MADIFVSYSKEDTDRARLLAARLQAEGFTVWWDQSLLSGDRYRNVIMTELASARAVIVIWTANSVISDFVQSEAGRALADQKLIPVKDPQLTYSDIPPPFDNFHTTNIDRIDGILSAISLQLAKPSSTPSVWHRLSYETLAHIAVIGTAVSLFASADAILRMSHWAAIIGDRWHTWLSRGLAYPLAKFDLSIPPYYVGLVGFVLFMLVLAVCARVLSRADQDRHRYSIRFQILLTCGVLSVVAACAFNVVMSRNPPSLFLVLPTFTMTLLFPWIAPSPLIFPLLGIYRFSSGREALYCCLSLIALTLLAIAVFSSQDIETARAQIPSALIIPFVYTYSISVFLILDLMLLVIFYIAPAMPLSIYIWRITLSFGMLSLINKVSNWVGQ